MFSPGKKLDRSRAAAKVRRSVGVGVPKDAAPLPPQVPVGRQRSVLLVAAEPAAHGGLLPALQQAGYACVSVASVSAARTQLYRRLPDLLILDGTAPESGEVPDLSFLGELRRGAATRTLPIVLLLNGLATVDERVHGLELGADDCVASPVVEPELVARVHALLRRAEAGGGVPVGTVLRVEPLELDTAAKLVAVNGRVRHLGPTEFELLKLFMQHPDRVFSREQLRERLRGPGAQIELRAVDVFIRRLRVALAPYGRARWIQTVHRQGYRLISALEE